MNLLTEFETSCRWFSSAAYCNDGILYKSDTREIATLEGTPIFCSACDGTGHILSKTGEQLVDLVWRRLQRKIYEAIREVRDIEEGKNGAK